jgi:hypothetical protein
MNRYGGARIPGEKTAVQQNLCARPDLPEQAGNVFTNSLGVNLSNKIDFGAAVKGPLVFRRKALGIAWPKADQSCFLHLDNGLRNSLPLKG